MKLSRRGDGEAVAQDEQGPGKQVEPGEKTNRWVLHLTLGLLVVVVPLVVWLTQDTEPQDPSVIELADQSPDFTLELFDGTSFTLSDHLERDGRPVVMNFWASWCLPCREEMPAFDAVAARRPDVYFLGVAVQDTETEARAFAEEIGVGYPLGFDSDGTISDLYPILGLPTTSFITSDRTEAASWSGILDEAKLESLIAEHLTG